jgi:2-polyprenyl-6-methoxyphenol hydroxylase-like FAD-dependent oxidoreductase
MKVIIAGGGIGGLTTALMLHARNIDCDVYEQAEAIRELGVGINTLPHSIRELAELGLLDQLNSVGIPTNELIYANRFGQEIWREARGVGAGYRFPQFSIHRGRLQGVIYQAARARLGDSRIYTGHRLGAFEEDASGVRAYFFDRSGSHRATAYGDALVGADGIHSVVRAALFPNEGPPTWNGIMAWRGATEWPVFLDGRSMIVAGGLAAKLVIYPIAQGSRRDNRLTNWAVTAKLSDGSVPPPRKEDWSRPGRISDLMPHASLFRIPHLDVRRLIEGTAEFWEYPLCDRDPLPYWSRGRVTLLGDAAHPMYPVGSNGASQAILDARALANKLVTAEHPNHALWEYERDRLPPTAQIVYKNRQGGPEGVIDMIERIAPDGFGNIEDILPFGQREAIVRGYASAAGYALEQVNRPGPRAA